MKMTYDIDLCEAPAYIACKERQNEENSSLLSEAQSLVMTEPSLAVGSLR
jgi:hypothetical protein